MLKRMILAVLMTIIAVGCASQEAALRKQNQSLQKQLSEKESRIDTLQNRVDTMEKERRQQALHIDELKKEKAGVEQEVDEISAEKRALEQQRQELQELVKNLSGIKVEQRAGGNYIVMENQILFPAGKAEIGPKGREALQKIADYLEKYPKQMIRIDGHTDSDPIKLSGWKSNWHLAAMRAHAVMAQLKETGVENERMYIVGYGYAKPAAWPEKTPKDKAKNRRVEILMVPASQSLGENILDTVSD